MKSMFARYRSIGLLIIPLIVSMPLLTAGCTPRAVVAYNDDTSGGGLDLSFLKIASDRFELADGPGRIGILLPEVIIHDVSEGGVYELRDDWSTEASELAAMSAALALKRRGYTPLILPDPGHWRDFFNLKARLRYHCTAFQSDFFAEKRRAFGGDEDSITFSIGQIGVLCDRYGVDAFLYVYGFEEKFSDERRRFLQDSVAAVIINEALSETPSAADIAVNPERTFLSVILADRSGRISWYRHSLTHGDLDMRNEEHSRLAIGALFE